MKRLKLGLNSKSDIKSVVYFDFHYIGELVLLKNYKYFLIVVSVVSVVDCKWGKILRRMVIVCLIFGRMLGLYFLFFFVYLSLICILLFKMLIIGIYLDINGMPMILCLISVYEIFV